MAECCCDPTWERTLAIDPGTSGHLRHYGLSVSGTGWLNHGLWIRDVDPPNAGSVQIQAIAVDDDGNVYCGHLGAGTETGDAVLVKYSPIGNRKWRQVITGGVSITCLRVRGSHVFGTCKADGALQQLIFKRKIDDGSVVWENDTSLKDTARNGIAVDDSGDVWGHHDNLAANSTITKLDGSDGSYIGDWTLDGTAWVRTLEVDGTNSRVYVGGLRSNSWTLKSFDLSMSEQWSFDHNAAVWSVRTNGSFILIGGGIADAVSKGIRRVSLSGSSVWLSHGTINDENGLFLRSDGWSYTAGTRPDLAPASYYTTHYDDSGNIQFQEYFGDVPSIGGPSQARVVAWHSVAGAYVGGAETDTDLPS